MSSVTVTNLQEVAERIRALGGTPDRALDATAEDVEEYFANAAGQHTKTGALGASITKRRISGGWEVFHDLQRAPHALFVHWGTKPHEIRPKGRTLNSEDVLAGKGGGKTVLRWPVAGGFRFAKVVHHPGYRGDPWAVEAARMAPLAFERHVSAEIARITKG